MEGSKSGAGTGHPDFTFLPFNQFSAFRKAETGMSGIFPLTTLYMKRASNDNKIQLIVN